MFNFVGKAITGKMLYLVGGLLLALLLALAATGWMLKKSIASEATAQQQATQLRSDLQHQVSQTKAAHLRYLSLDGQFLALQKRKEQIQATTETEFIYIRESAKHDQTVTAHLNAGIPAAINCVLAESCHDH